MTDFETPSADSRILPCRVGGETFCLDESRVQEIEGGEHVQRNPGPGHPFGWLLNRADEIEVYNLAELLGLDAPAGNNPMSVLVIESETAAFGLVVDQVLEPSSVEPSDRQALPPWVQNRRAGFFDGVVRRQDTLWLHLAPERLHPQALPHLPERVSPPMRHPARVATRDADASATNTAQLLAFAGINPALEGQDIYGLSTRQVVEIHQLPRVVPVPTSADFIHGMTNYRDRAIPVVDLDHFLGLGAKTSLGAKTVDPLQQAQLLVVRMSVFDPSLDMDQPWVGFPIERQVRIVDLPLACRAVEPDAQLVGRIRGVFTIENLRLIVPDVDAIPALA